MSRLLRRLLPFAAAFAWRNRSQISDWYQGRRNPPDRPPAGTGGGSHS